MTARLIVALIAATPAHGQPMFMTGNELYTQCTSPDELVCSGFVMGVSDTIATYQSASAVRSVICLPKGVNTGHLIDAVVKYLGEKPEVRHYTAASSVIGAMLEAFPCRKVGETR